VKEALPHLQAAMPADVSVTVAIDRSTTIRASLRDTELTLLIAITLVTLVVYFFLRNFRATLIPGIVVPISILGTFGGMYLLGYSLNILSLMALTIATGFVVDDAIVVLENIYRHLSRGESPKEAAINGRSEIGMAALTITMADVVVFLPMAIMGGVVGRFFREFCITVACSTLFSLLVSFTVTPMLASRWLSTQHGEPTGPLAHFGVVWDRGYERLAAGYRWVLARALKVRWAVVALSATLAQHGPSGQLCHSITQFQSEFFTGTKSFGK